MFKRIFNVLPHKTSTFPQALTIPTSPLFLMQPSLCYQPFNFFSSGSSRNNRNNNNNTDNQLLPTPGLSSKLTKHDVEIKSKGTTINVKVQGKTISYDLGKVVKGATLGDTNRYVLMCTCNVCGNKIVKTFTKKAYHNGVVVILCEKCDNNHLIADNLGWFRDKPVNIESLAKEKGDSVTKIYPDNNMKKLINNLVFVGDKHTATIESDRMGLASSSFLQMIENIEPGHQEVDVKTGRFGGKRGIN